MDRIAAMDLPDEGHGVDLFGMSADGLRRALRLTGGLYRYWFRVRSRGHDHIPRAGAAIIAANHSGTLPFDAMMLWTDVLTRTSPPRVVRTVADHFVPNIPFISPMFAQAGAVGGSRGNLRWLLDRGELVAVFPEGTPGIGKPFRERYRLQGWRVGHAELALLHRVPVIPAAIIGAEEQMPQLGRLNLHLFGAPYLPVALPPFPLPVRYHILYGPPLRLHERFDPTRAREPAVVEPAAALVAEAVRGLIAEGLRWRRGIFR